MEKKTKFGELVSGVGKNAKDLLGKSKNIAMHIADQNDDGKLDLKDVSVIAESVGNTVKREHRRCEKLQKKQLEH